MNKTPGIAAASPNAPGLRGIKFSLDWITRPLFGAVLAGSVTAAIFAGSVYLAVFVAVAALFATREWQRMVGGGAAESVVTVAAIALALVSLTFWPHGLFAWSILGVGALVVLAVASVRGRNPLWQAAGTLYIGVPALALVALRSLPLHGAWLIIGMFIVVWTTDTGALFAGNLVGGPKIAPIISPNKTWAGTLGGIGAAAVAEAVYIGVIGGDIALALLFGAGLALTAHAGDFFESWVKRRFHFKDSGALIPGHGGVLDRIDSTLAAATALAILVFALGLDPLFGAQP